MSKILILLLATLVVLTVNASGSTDELRSVQDRPELHLATEIERLEAKYNSTIKTIVDDVRELASDTDFLAFQFHELIRSIWKQAKDDTLELRVQVLIIEGTENCDEIVNSIYEKGQVLWSNLTTCCEGIRETASHSSSKMYMMYHRLLDTLIDLRDRIDACARIFNTTTEAESATLCIEKIRTQAESCIKESIPSISAEIDKLNGRLRFLLRTGCIDGLVDYHDHAIILTALAKECYQRKINEAHNLLAKTLEPIEEA